MHYIQYVSENKLTKLTRHASRVHFAKKNTLDNYTLEKIHFGSKKLGDGGNFLGDGGNLLSDGGKLLGDGGNLLGDGGNLLGERTDGPTDI